MANWYIPVVIIAGIVAIVITYINTPKEDIISTILNIKCLYLVS